MITAKRGEIHNARMLTTQQACEYIGMGRNTGRAFLDQIGATKTFGRMVRFDKNVIDAALDARNN